MTQLSADNLELWRSVEKTDPKHVKPITGKSYSGSSPKPYYLIRKATETFGPIGQGWGFSILSERIEDGSDGDKLHIARVKVWYEWNGKRGEVEHIGATPFSGKRSSGKSFIDEDAAKKSVTDALIKALSYIGFAGDIFMGRYDDSAYVREIGEEFREAERNNEPASDELYMRHALDKIAAMTDRAELDAWYQAETDNRQRMLEAPQIATLFKAMKARRAELGAITERAA